MITYIDIIKYMEHFCTAHEQIDNYQDGNPAKINQNTEHNMVWSSLVTSTVQREYMQLRFDVYFLDLLKKDDENAVEVTSNMLIIANDFINYFYNFDNFQLNIENGVTLSPIEDWDSYRGGVKISIELIIPIQNNCTINIPI